MIGSTEIGQLKLFHWILLFFIAVFTYYSTLFQTKAVKSLEKMYIVYPFSILSVVVSYFFDLAFFERGVFSNELISVLIIIINTVFYSSKIVKNLKSTKQNQISDE
jgi:drug/metabolite transporter (DMT)-like permease